MRQTVSLFFVAMCVAAPVAAQQSIREIPAVPAIVEQQAPPLPPLPPQPARVPAAPTPPTSAPRVAAPTPQAAPQAGEAPSAPRQVDPRIDQSEVNIKLVAKISDTGGSAPSSKTVSLSIANMGSGRVRSSGVTPGRGSLQMSVDANAELRKNGLIHVSLTIFYAPEQSEETAVALRTSTSPSRCF